MRYTAQPLYSALILTSVCANTIFKDCRAGWSLWLTASLQVVRTSLQRGSPSVNSKRLLKKHLHVARWDCRLKQMHVRRDMWLLKDYLSLQDACKCFNFLFPLSRVHSWNRGHWPFERLEKHETAVSLRQPATLLLWTQIEIVINLSEKAL